MAIHNQRPQRSPRPPRHSQRRTTTSRSLTPDELPPSTTKGRGAGSCGR
jgi:hypothetical protein